MTLYLRFLMVAAVLYALGYLALAASGSAPPAPPLPRPRPIEAPSLVR